MSYSTHLLKLQLFQLILPSVISALKRLAYLKREREERKEKEEDKRPKRKGKIAKSRFQIREVCYPQGVIIELYIHHQSLPLITTFIMHI